MTIHVVRYDQDTGHILANWHEPDHDYELGPGEMVPDEEYDEPGALDGMMVDTSSESPTIVQDPNEDTRSLNEKLQDRLNEFVEDGSVSSLQEDLNEVPLGMRELRMLVGQDLEDDIDVAMVARRRLGEPTKQDFWDAREEGDLQGQLDALFKIVVGQDPEP